MDRQSWHENLGKRVDEGTSAEDEFDNIFLCHCGGVFIKNDLHNKYAPDRRCKNCGQLVDVKSPPNILDYEHITISQRPFDKYPPSLIIAVRIISGFWKGIHKKDTIAKGPFDPTHKQKGTRFYKIEKTGFENLWDLLETKP